MEKENISAHTNLELILEYLCSTDIAQKRMIEQEISLRKMSEVKFRFFKFICKCAIPFLAFNELQYESFMYKNSEIVRSLTIIFFLNIIVFSGIAIFAYLVI